ncbi:hypothetical protein GY167_25370, partial [Burkholderia multivorans]|nr:hypothetical protein [Burkholderia multivorans]
MNRSDNLSSIHADRIAIKQAVVDRNPAWQRPKPQTWCAIRDIVFDWFAVFVSVWITHRIGWATAPIVRISAMVINRFGERDQSGRWCCAVNG